VGDLDGDGNLDLVVALEQRGIQQIATILVLLGAGDGTFRPGKTYLVPYPVSIAAGDLTATEWQTWRRPATTSICSATWRPC
jgi:hypothetical protein